MRLPITADIRSATGDPVYPQGATEPPLRVAFTDADGTPVDLSNPARALVKLRRSESDEIHERRLTVPRDTASDGIVEYQWIDDDTAAPGVLYLRFIVETTTGTEYVLPTDSPVEVSIQPQL